MQNLEYATSIVVNKCDYMFKGHANYELLPFRDILQLSTLGTLYYHILGFYILFYKTIVKG